MSDEGAQNASTRIDRALARIEAASRQLEIGQSDLLRRHDALRTQVADAIAALDSLIAEEVDED